MPRKSHSISNELLYDVFISYGSSDRHFVNQLSKRLQNDGLRVWVDKSSGHHQDDQLLNSEHVLSRSHTLILVLSSSIRDSEWSKLEQYISLFSDPSDNEKQFIPLLIEDCEIPERISRYKYIDWRDSPDENYQILLNACRPRAAQQKIIKEPPLAVIERQIKGHKDKVWSVAFLPDCRMMLSGSIDCTVTIWDVSSGNILSLLENPAIPVANSIFLYSRAVFSVTASPNGAVVVTGSDDNTVKFWELATKKVVSILEGHSGSVNAVAVTPDSKYVISASSDHDLRVWDFRYRRSRKLLWGHSGSVNAVAVTPDSKYVISASQDSTLRLWDIELGKCIRIFRGHECVVWSVAITPDGRQAVSGAIDGSIKIWNIKSGECVASIEGHYSSIKSLAISPNNLLIASASLDRTVKLWSFETGACLQTINGESGFTSIAFSSDGTRLLFGADDGSVHVYRITDTEATLTAVESRKGVRYTNAKVVLVGESGVGKSGLGYRLAEDRWLVTESTHGMKVWPLKLSSSSQQPNIEREIWLWDLAGQPEYRLVHQLFLDETSLALVLFNPQSEDPFEGLGDWEKALRMAVGRDPEKILVAARIDRGGATVTERKINRFGREHGFCDYIATSAKLNEGCIELKEALLQSIPWDYLPWTATTKQFKALKDAIVRLKDNELVLIRFSELRQYLQLSLPDELFKEEDLRTVIGLLAGQGLVKRLDFGDFVLLQPEQLNNYAAAVIRVAREHVDGIGCINEQDVLNGKFDFKDMQRLSKADEEILLRALVQTFLDQSLCIREETPSGVQLVFPSQFNREIEIPVHPNVIVSYRFSGHLPTVYTTLVVRLTYSDTFEKKDLWKNAAEFRTPEGKRVGLVMKRVDEGVGEIKIFFDAGVPDDTRVTFIKYVHEHLLKRANDVEREREYVCTKCSQPVENHKVIRERLALGKTDIICIRCDERIPLLDLIELKFNDDQFLKRVQELDAKARINLDNESLELLLVGQAISITAEAGQIYRGYTNSDHGIDGEIEFKDKNGQASGRKIYLQLKSGDSYLHRRRRDGQEIFTVKKERHLKYWQSHAYPVYLIVRTSDGVIRWMNVSEQLQRQVKSSKQIIFEGEPFTSYTLMKLRDKYI